MIKKIKTKLEYFKYTIPMIWQVIRFRLKVWWHNIKN